MRSALSEMSPAPNLFGGIMSPALFSSRLPLCALLLALALSVPLPGADPAKPSGGSTLQAHFTDGSVVKLTLKDERVEIVTPYGKLLVPVTEIHRIELGTRIPEEDAKRIE